MSMHEYLHTSLLHQTEIPILVNGRFHVGRAGNKKKRALYYIICSLHQVNMRISINKCKMPQSLLVAHMLQYTGRILL